MSDPILIQIDDEVRKATPEEAAAILASQGDPTTLAGADNDNQ